MILLCIKMVLLIYILKYLIVVLEEKNNLRKKLQSMIVSEYNIMRRTGVLQFHFVSPDNISFLRMHNLDKFDDDLSKVRQDIVNTNKNKTISRGLVKGKTIHGFRNVYPIFNDTWSVFRNNGNLI